MTMSNPFQEAEARREAARAKLIKAGKAYDFRPYDILQISRDKGKTWEDFSSIRTESDAWTASSYCQGRAPVRFRTDKNEQFRIVRDDHRTVAFAGPSRKRLTK
jgi:hypothetical protein